MLMSFILVHVPTSLVMTVDFSYIYFFPLLFLSPFYFFTHQSFCLTVDMGASMTRLQAVLVLVLSVVILLQTVHSWEVGDPRPEGYTDEELLERDDDCLSNNYVSGRSVQLRTTT